MPLPKITRRRQREAAPASLDNLFVGWLMAHPGGEFEVCRHCQLEMTKSIDLRPCYGPAPPHGVPPGPMWVWTCSCGFEFPGRELTLDECADECHAAATILFSRDSQVAAPLPLSFPVFGSIAYWLGLVTAMLVRIALSTGHAWPDSHCKFFRYRAHPGVRRISWALVALF